MDFNDTGEEAAFRARLRQWLHDHSADAAIPDDPAARADAQNAWHQTLHEAGYIGLSFPVEYGGHGLPLSLATVVMEDLGSANMGFSLVMMLTPGAVEARVRRGRFPARTRI